MSYLCQMCVQARELNKNKQNQTLVKSCCNFKPVPAVQSPKQPLWQSLPILASSFLFIHTSVSINSTLQLVNRHLDLLGLEIKTQSSPLLKLCQLTAGSKLHPWALSQVPSSLRMQERLRGSRNINIS